MGILIGVAAVALGLYGALGKSAPRVSMTWQRAMNKIFTLGKWKADLWPESAGLVRFGRWGLVVVGVVAIVITLTQPS